MFGVIAVSCIALPFGEWYFATDRIRAAPDDAIWPEVPDRPVASWLRALPRFAVFCRIHVLYLQQDSHLRRTPDP
jgi:hypothetical protein